MNKSEFLNHEYASNRHNAALSFIHRRVWGAWGYKPQNFRHHENCDSTNILKLLMGKNLVSEMR
jgi:hypothetical protein